MMSSRVTLANIELHLGHSENHAGLKRAGSEFHWTLSNSEVRAFPGQLRGLAAADGPAHVYFDTPLKGGNVQAIASKNEYDPATIFTAQAS
jgi:hypothetical protein